MNESNEHRNWKVVRYEATQDSARTALSAKKWNEPFVLVIHSRIEYSHEAK